LGLAVLSTHKLNTTTPRTNAAASAVEKRSDVEEEAATPAPAEKVKVASLMKPAQVDSIQQAEMSFDVNAFNF
jgi:hypothetical protein